VIGFEQLNMMNVVNMWASGTTTAAANTTAALALDVKYNNDNATGSLTTTEASVEILN
jgi:hypothetical protein